MRIIAQIVRDATLRINKEVYSEIHYGLFLLVSFAVGDNAETAINMADKVIKMRIFPDREGKTNLNIATVGGEILSVSQFTLYGDFKGRRPSFTKVLPGAQSRELYDIFNEALRREANVKTGLFGEMMDITFTNVGPATYWLESDEKR